jgi:RNA polymerase sigma factor (sigma-70 family)
MIVRFSMKDEVLINKCIENNRIAQKQLYDKYKDAMYTLAYRITGNHNDAEDSLQESFINVFQNLQSFKGNSTIGAWIKTILVRNAIKKTKARFEYEDITERENNEQYKIDENITGEYLEQAILSLNPGYRAVFILIEVEGFKHKEVSERLNISVGTSKSQLFHAKKQLKMKLQDFCN